MANSVTAIWARTPFAVGLPIESFPEEGDATGNDAVSLSAQVYRDFQQLDESVAAFWKRAQWHPDGDLDLVAREHRERKEEWGLHILAVRDRDEIISCVVGKIIKVPLKLQFGYKVAAGPVLSTLVAHHSGFIGRWEHPHYVLVQKHWQQMLASRAVDAVHLRAIPIDSPVQAIACSAVPFLRRGHFEVMQESWQLTQLQSFAAFLQKHPTLRKRSKYYRNRLNRAFAGKVAIKSYDKPNQLEVMLQDSEEIGRETWQRKLGGASFLEDEERSRYQYYLSRGWCRVYILYLDHIPAAFVHGIAFGEVFYVLKLGYHPDYRDLSVGTYLLLHVIKEFCGDDRIHTLDFNVGNDEAKRQYCDHSVRVSDIHLFAPGWRLWLPILLRLSTQASHELAKAISRRCGIYQSVKKRWRRIQ